MSEDQRSLLKSLISKGKEQGYLTFSEVNDHLPDDLFAGPHERVLVGMKVHANTISHARLVALEETFPRTRDVI